MTWKRDGILWGVKLCNCFEQRNDGIQSTGGEMGLWQEKDTSLIIIERNGEV